MKLYVLKHKRYKLYPQNCWEITNFADGYVILGHVRKKEALVVQRQIKEKYGIDLEIMVFESKEGK